MIYLAGSCQSANKKASVVQTGAANNGGILGNAGPKQVDTRVAHANNDLGAYVLDDHATPSVCA